MAGASKEEKERVRGTNKRNETESLATPQKKAQKLSRKVFPQPEKKKPPKEAKVN